jgi:hypothetical protein
MDNLQAARGDRLLALVFELDIQNQLTNFPVSYPTMSLTDKFSRYYLESLILAQNERWWYA